MSGRSGPPRSGPRVTSWPTGTGAPRCSTSPARAAAPTTWRTTGSSTSWRRRSRPAGSRSTPWTPTTTRPGPTPRSPARSAPGATTRTTRGSPTRWPARSTTTAAAGCPIVTAGASMGAFHAVNLALRRADLFPHAIGMSGNYDPGSWHAWGEMGDALYFNNPAAYVPNLYGDHLDWLRSRVFIQLVVGSGAFEEHPTRALPSSWALAQCAVGQGDPLRPGRLGHRHPARLALVAAHGRQAPRGALSASHPRGPTAPDPNPPEHRRTRWTPRPAPTSSGCCWAPRRTGRWPSSPWCAPSGPIPDAHGTNHEIATERITIEPFNLRDKPRQELVIDRLAYWYYVPARVAEEGRADGRRLPAQQPVHVPVDGEALGLLRDDAPRDEDPRDRAGALQEPAGPRQVRLHRRALQPALRPGGDRRARSATRCT